jgi:hypothetical protein
LPKDDQYDNVRPLHRDQMGPAEWSQIARSFEEACKNAAIKDVVSQFQAIISELGDDKIHGVMAIVVTKDGDDAAFAYTPSLYENGTAYAMTLACLSMTERQIHDEAEEYRLEELSEELQD